METVTVTEVEKNDRGWYEIRLEGDDRVLATKSKALADAAFASRGNETEAEINTSTRGSFTNHYLNSIAGVEDSKPAKNGSRSKSAPATSGRSEETQERIARQWAYGRAVELLMASGQTFEFPLDKSTLADLEATAKLLLDKTR